MRYLFRSALSAAMLAGSVYLLTLVVPALKDEAPGGVPHGPSMVAAWVIPEVGYVALVVGLVAAGVAVVAYLFDAMIFNAPAAKARAAVAPPAGESPTPKPRPVVRPSRKAIAATASATELDRWRMHLLAQLQMKRAREGGEPALPWWGASAPRVGASEAFAEPEWVPPARIAPGVYEQPSFVAEEPVDVRSTGFRDRRRTR